MKRKKGTLIRILLCPKCQGKKIILAKQMHNSQIYEALVPCQACKGHGRIWRKENS